MYVHSISPSKNERISRHLIRITMHYSGSVHIQSVSSFKHKVPLPVKFNEKFSALSYLFFTLPRFGRNVPK